MSTFTGLSPDEKHAVREILASSDPRPSVVPMGGNTQRNYQHVEHCMHQCWRFAHLATQGHPFRTLQFGFNIGRAQEILGSIGGVDYWWRQIERVVAAARQPSDYQLVVNLIRNYCNDLAIEWPGPEFINRL